MSEQLKFRDVTLGYDRHPAVDHSSGEVGSGALLGIVGPNGAGKSTLFRGVVGILKPLAGSIETGGLDIRDIAYLPQIADIDRSFPISVFDFVGTGLWRMTGFFGGIGKGARDKIGHACAAVGLNGFENRPIGTLSGGQMQRMLFARVLLQDARLIVLDEPFNAIDTRTSADLLALVRRWHAEKRTVLAALHDMELVRANFPETLLLARGPVAWGATADVLTVENLQQARRMCGAVADSRAAFAGAALLSGGANAGRDDCIGQGQQYRSRAGDVGQYPGDGRPDSAGHPLQRNDYIGRTSGDLPPAGDRKRRRGVPARRKPRRCARGNGVCA